MSENDDTYTLDRRSTLRALGVGAGAVAGISAFSGRAVAWERFDVCFKDCSEVWMITHEDDVGRDPPAEALVIVSLNGQTDCHTVKFTDANAETEPEMFGDRPVVKYAPGGDYKVLGVQEINYGTGEPTWCVTVNENACATESGTPSVFDASCVDDAQPVCPAGGNYCECPPCESGEELLVKYEWDGGEFVTEGSDDNIELDSVTLDEEGEPEEVCFTTEYCEVDAVVKAGQGYEVYSDESGALCVTGITTENPQGKEITKAISNIQFFCVAPDDPSVGNSGGGGGEGGGPPGGRGPP